MSLVNFQSSEMVVFVVFTYFPYFCGRLSSLRSSIGWLSTNPEVKTHPHTTAWLKRMVCAQLKTWQLFWFITITLRSTLQEFKVDVYTGPFFLTHSTNICKVSTKHQEIRPYSHTQQGSGLLGAEEVAAVEHIPFITIISHIICHMISCHMSYVSYHMS